MNASRRGVVQILQLGQHTFHRTGTQGSRLRKTVAEMRCKGRPPFLVGDQGLGMGRVLKTKMSDGIF